MSQHIRVKHDKTLPERLKEQVLCLKKEAAKTPSDVYRDLLLRRASQIEAASRMERWLASSELRPPK